MSALTTHTDVDAIGTTCVYTTDALGRRQGLCSYFNLAGLEESRERWIDNVKQGMEYRYRLDENSKLVVLYSVRLWRDGKITHQCSEYAYLTLLPEHAESRLTLKLATKGGCTTSCHTDATGQKWGEESILRSDKSVVYRCYSRDLLNGLMVDIDHNGHIARAINFVNDQPVEDSNMSVPPTPYVSAIADRNREANGLGTEISNLDCDFRKHGKSYIFDTSVLDSSKALLKVSSYVRGVAEGIQYEYTYINEKRMIRAVYLAAGGSVTQWFIPSYAGPFSIPDQEGAWSNPPITIAYDTGSIPGMPVETRISDEISSFCLSYTGLKFGCEHVVYKPKDGSPAYVAQMQTWYAGVPHGLKITFAPRDRIFRVQNFVNGVCVEDSAGVVQPPQPTAQEELLRALLAAVRFRVQSH